MYLKEQALLKGKSIGNKRGLKEKIILDMQSSSKICFAGLFLKDAFVLSKIFYL